jgi:hypothetical protein
MQPLYERGRFQTTYHDLTEALGACVIGATVFETKAGSTRGPYHFHDGVEELAWLSSDSTTSSRVGALASSAAMRLAALR